MRARRKRDRRRVIAAARNQEIHTAAFKPSVVRARLDPPVLPKRLARRRALKPVVVVDAPSIALPAAARPGRLTGKVKAAPVLRGKAGTLATVPAPKLAVARLPEVKRAAILQRERSPAKPMATVRRAATRAETIPQASTIKGTAKPSRTPEKASIPPSTTLHGPDQRKDHSTSKQSRREGAAICKERPGDKTPRGSGKGTRSFVPWCK